MTARKNREEKNETADGAANPRFPFPAARYKLGDRVAFITANREKLMYQLAKTMAIAFVACAIAIGGAMASDDDVMVKKSNHDVATTLDRLETIVGEKGITVMARVDHAKNAESAGMELRPTQLLIFGNPKLGTALMQANQRIGLDLPMKVLAWEDGDGQVWIAYEDPEEVAERHGIAEDHEVVQKLRKALDAFTGAAAE